MFILTGLHDLLTGGGFDKDGGNGVWELCFFYFFLNFRKYIN
jgi:hypothetical protein